MSSRDKPGLAGMAVFVTLVVVPIAAGLLYGALYSVGLAGWLREGFTLRHWAVVLASGELWASIGLSLYVGAAVVAGTTVLSLLFGLTLGEHLRTGPLAYLIYVPLALPGTVAGFFTFQMLTASGLLARLLLRCGLLSRAEDFPALVQDRQAAGIILAHIALATPFFTLLFAELYRSEKIETLVTLARSLGATRAQGLTRVVLPIILRAGWGNLFMLFVAVLGSYEIPMLLGRQSPEMLSILTLRKFAMYDLSQKPDAFVVAMLYAASTVLLVTMVLRKSLAKNRA